MAKPPVEHGVALVADQGGRGGVRMLMNEKVVSRQDSLPIDAGGMRAPLCQSGERRYGIAVAGKHRKRQAELAAMPIPVGIANREIGA